MDRENVAIFFSVLIYSDFKFEFDAYPLYLVYKTALASNVRTVRCLYQCLNEPYISVRICTFTRYQVRRSTWYYYTCFSLTLLANESNVPRARAAALQWDAAATRPSQVL